MVESGEHPKVTQLRTDLDSLQKAVSIRADYQGRIEPVNPDTHAVTLSDGEGKLIGLPGNRRTGRDVIASVFCVIRSDCCGKLVPLSEQQLEPCKARFWEPEDMSAQDWESCPRS